MIFHTMMLTENVLVFGKEELSTLFTDDFAHANVTLTKLSFGSCHKSKYASPLIWQRIQEQESQVSTCVCERRNIKQQKNAKDF